MMHFIAEHLGLNPIHPDECKHAHMQYHRTQNHQCQHDHASPTATLKSLNFGSACGIGARDHQEDRFTCVDNLSKDGSAYFGVFDGHGTDRFASHTSSNLHRIIFNSEAFKSGDYERAIREGILNEDKELYESFAQHSGGSTATACIITHDKLYLGNVGDSRAIVGISNGSQISGQRLSRDHKPDDADERVRIQRAGGYVVRGRVRGETSAINMSRAVGDFEFKTPQNHSTADWIASEPFIANPVSLSPEVQFCVLASDGLWNVVGDYEAAELVHKMHNEGLKPKEIAESLVAMCERVPLADNTTVIVIFFEYEETAAAAKP